MNPRMIIIQQIFQNWKLLADGKFFEFVNEINSTLKNYGFSEKERRLLMDECQKFAQNEDEGLKKAFCDLAKNFK